ncbi:uncharacterized protein LOC129925782 [Biomphalaria glabrata]|uniref:Uncharacterized protein LOC129925782 n=1 Tax=Biomphalaria glabrata TaxID=6526 RepID=A0A9W3A4N3_BIOGL|nr:uncharacterized protein LOC129925782 [Biomphalaria glabrata]
MTNKSLCFTVYVTTGTNVSEAVAGCLSISVAWLSHNMLNKDSKIINGWYALLPLEQGQTEHVLVLVKSPRELLHDVKIGQCSDHTFSRYHDVIEAEFELPVSDGSVCGGHIKEGQLETDVDAAFCCLLGENCSASSLSVISDKAYCKPQCCSNTSADFHELTTQRCLTPNAKCLLENSLNRTKHPLENSAQLLCSVNGRRQDNRCLREAQSNDIKEGNNFGKNVVNYHSANMKEKQNSSLKNFHADTTCCNTMIVLETIKNQVRKIKHLNKGCYAAVHVRDTTNGTIIDNVATISRMTESVGLNCSGNESENLLYKTWCSERMSSRLESFSFPGEKFDQHNSFNPLCRSTDTRSLSASSTPICSLNKTSLSATQRKVVCFYKNNFCSEIGICLTERDTVPSNTVQNSLETSADTFPGVVSIKPKRLFVQTSTPLTAGRRFNSHSLLSVSCTLQNSTRVLENSSRCDFSYEHSRLGHGEASNIHQNMHENTVCFCSEKYDEASNSNHHYLKNRNTSDISKSALIKATQSFDKSLSYTNLNSRQSVISIDSLSSSASSDSLSTDHSSSSSNCSSNYQMTVHETCRVVIAKVAKHSAAESKGLKPGDSVLFINNNDVRLLSKDQVLKLLSRIKGEVKLEVERKLNLDWIK